MAKRLEVTYHVYDSPAALARAAAEHFVKRAEDSVAKRGRARFAISGGSTPKATFALLADPAEPFLKQMPWDKLELFQVDERTVPPDHADSNYKMTKAALLDRVPMPAEHFFRMEGELDPEEAASRYESIVRQQFRLEGAEAPRFDVVQLGMGDDGHTASLFPHTEGISELGRVVFANHVPQKDTWRITFSAPVLNEANDVFFLIAGADKAAPLEQVLFGDYDPAQWPSQLIQPVNGALTMLLDQAAAAKLPKPDAHGIGKVELSR